MKPRFTRTADWIGGSKIASRDNRSPGDFLGRLWSRFGPPDPCDGGFSYSVHDATTGVRFRAYSGPSGPAYGGDPAIARDPLIRDFERYLADARVADCRIEIGGDFGPHEIGAAGGVPFERAILLGPLPTTARTVADCLAIARQHGETHLQAMGLRPGSVKFTQLVMPMGFVDCLAEVVELRDMVIDGAMAEAIEMCPGKQDITVAYDTGSKLREIPLAEARLAPRGKAGALWLEAWATCRASSRRQ